MKRLYCLNNSVSSRIMGQDFLLYSGNSRETLIVNQLTYELIIFLTERNRSYQEILEYFGIINQELERQDLLEVVDKTLKLFFDSGVLDSHEA